MLNCVRLLTRVIPFLFEDPQWRMMFWATTNIPSAPAPPTSTPSAAAGGGAGGAGSPTLALGQMLLNAVTDLLFCPDFTVKGKKKKGQPVSRLGWEGGGGGGGGGWGGGPCGEALAVLLCFCMGHDATMCRLCGLQEKQEDLSHVDSCEHLWYAVASVSKCLHLAVPPPSFLPSPPFSRCPLQGSWHCVQCVSRLLRVPGQQPD